MDKWNLQERKENGTWVNVRYVKDFYDLSEVRKAFVYYSSIKEFINIEFRIKNTSYN